jgi:hypothetical protein
MKDNDKIYRELQQLLDKETIGFPESQSGSAVGVLEQMFTPQQAPTMDDMMEVIMANKSS